MGGSAIAFNTDRYELSTVISNVNFDNNGPSFAIIKRGSYGKVYIINSSPLPLKEVVTVAALRKRLRVLLLQIIGRQSSVRDSMIR